MTSDGSGTDSFTSLITGLQPETTYYLRAYATNSAGTAYGSQISFATITDVTFSTTSDGSLLLHSVANKKIIYTCNGSNCYIKYSSNNGNSYNAGVLVTGLFHEDNKARILSNGDIVLFVGSKIYYSNDNMTTITPCTVLDKNGNPYILHTPVNPEYPRELSSFYGRIC